jgi:hypothetical protein
MKVASIGECMVELSDAGAGLFSRAFGGDTLNTALYLARTGIPQLKWPPWLALPIRSGAKSSSRPSN